MNIELVMVCITCLSVQCSKHPVILKEKKILEYIQLVKYLSYEELLIFIFYTMQINSDESWLSFDEEAYVLHNKVNFMILSEGHSCDIKEF